MLLSKTGLRDYFIPIFIFLSGITAELSTIHHFFTILFSFLFVSFFVLNLFYNRYRSYFDLKLLALILIYILWCFCSVLMSKYPYFALISLIRIVIFFIVIFGIYNYLNSFYRITLILKSIAYVGTAISISLLFEFIFNGFRLISSNGTIIRYTGVFTGPNAAGFVIGISIVIIVFLYKNSDDRKYNLLFLLNLIGITLTFSRSAWIMVIITLLPFILSRYVSRTIFRNILILVFVIAIGLVFKSDKMVQFLRIDKGNSGRDVIWNAAIHLIKDKPMGVGIGCYKKEIINYYDVPKGSWLWENYRTTVNDAHNLYLTVTADIGWIGLFILIITLGYFLIILTKNFWRAKANYSLEKLWFFLFFGFIARSFFEGNGFLTKGWIGIDIYMWIIFCISIKIHSMGKKDQMLGYA